LFGFVLLLALSLITRRGRRAAAVPGAPT